MLAVVDRAHQALDPFGKHLWLETSHSNRKVFDAKGGVARSLLFFGEMLISHFVQIHSRFR